MKYSKDPEFETTIFDAKTDILLPPILDIGGKYAYKGNIKAQWLKHSDGKTIHIRQEGEKVVVEHKEKIPNTYSQIVSYKGTRFVAEDFHSVIHTFIQMGFSPHREIYNKLRYAYVSRKDPEIGKVRFNFDTYELGGEKKSPVLKIVAKTEAAILEIAKRIQLDPSELNGIEPIHILNHLEQKK